MSRFIEIPLGRNKECAVCQGSHRVICISCSGSGHRYSVVPEFAKELCSCCLGRGKVSCPFC